MPYIGFDLDCERAVIGGDENDVRDAVDGGVAYIHPESVDLAGEVLDGYEVVMLDSEDSTN